MRQPARRRRSAPSMLSRIIGTEIAASGSAMPRSSATISRSSVAEGSANELLHDLHGERDVVAFGHLHMERGSTLLQSGQELRAPAANALFVRRNATASPVFHLNHSHLARSSARCSGSEAFWLTTPIVSSIDCKTFGFSCSRRSMAKLHRAIHRRSPYPGSPGACFEHHRIRPDPDGAWHRAQVPRRCGPGMSSR